MARQLSGQEFIEHKTNIIANIGEHFNNADISDVTLTVGEQTFAAHRFVLATQSKVFMAMLMGENWKESEERKITLQESAEGEAAFSDFLKFLYTGTLTLTIDNVCGIHTLVDKYDVPALKDDCVAFMKDVLTGIHGDALKAALQWLQYAECFLHDLVALCYSAIRTNFIGITRIEEYSEKFEKLADDQRRKIFSVSKVEDELVLVDELSLVTVFETYSHHDWQKDLQSFLRCYNLEIDELQEFKAEPLEQKIVAEKYINEAYIVHAERSNIASKACKRRRLSDDSVAVECPCEKSSSQVCPHINPRFYVASPFGFFTKFAEGVDIRVEPIDLTDVAGFSQRLLYPEDKSLDKVWDVCVYTEYSGESILCDKYIVSPAACHVARKFTIAITCILYEDETMKKLEYAIKHTGVVSRRGKVLDEEMLISQRRAEGSWQLTEAHAIGVSIILHKL